jgi:hypothetical protein
MVLRKTFSYSALKQFMNSGPMGSNSSIFISIIGKKRAKVLTY